MPPPPLSKKKSPRIYCLAGILNNSVPRYIVNLLRHLHFTILIRFGFFERDCVILIVSRNTTYKLHHLQIITE